MRLRFLFFFSCLILAFSCAGPTIDDVLKRYNRESVPYIQVEELARAKHVVILDTREWDEFEVSRIPGSVWVGNQSINLVDLKATLPNTDTTIVVYCSVGVRSEDMGEKLLKAGYTNVKNLYGGIFEWKNRGYPVLDPKGVETDKVHAYSKYWGQLLTDAKKVY